MKREATTLERLINNSILAFEDRTHHRPGECKERGDIGWYASGFLYIEPNTDFGRIVLARQNHMKHFGSGEAGQATAGVELQQLV